MNMLKYTAFLLALCLLNTACKEDNTEGEGTPYTGKTTTTYVSSDTGSYDFQIETTGAWSAAPINFASDQMLAIKSATQGVGKAKLTVYCRANNSFPREGRIAIKLAEARIADTIIIRQYGLQPVVEFRKTKATAYPAGGTLLFDLATNLPVSMFEQVEISTKTPDGATAEWVKNSIFSSVDSKVSCEIGSNLEASREADLVLTFKDDWGVAHQSTCRISQESMQNRQILTFAQARALVTDSEITVEGNYLIEGIIVSDNKSPNVAANPNTSTSQMDYTYNNRTAYIESRDGAYGFKVFFEQSAGNVFNRFDKVTLALNNVKITKTTNPEQYTLTNLSEGAIFGLEAGTAADMPIKEKYISELTADDLYTYVTLKECEFPIRKGSYTPINDGYSRCFLKGDGTYSYAYRVDAYPLAVRDAKGGHLFMMTNVSAPWRKTGQELPRGAGKLSGVIVNEKYTRFEQDGNIGDFQIRPIAESDIALEKDISKASLQLLVAWTDGYQLLTNGALNATAGRGEIAQTATTSSSKIGKGNDFSLLSPVTGNGTNPDKGISTNTAWSYTSWWDKTNNIGESWVVKFSTAGISANHLSLAFAVVNNSVGAPRYWAIEWSEHGQQLETWSRIAEYTVPDIVQWGNTLYTQSAGHKNISIELPAEMQGKEVVYLRLIPTSTKAGTTTTYDSGTYTGTSLQSHMSYLAIYYND